jgi:hypothetical protein
MRIMRVLVLRPFASIWLAGWLCGLLAIPLVVGASPRDDGSPSAGRISPERAASRAVHRLTRAGAGLELRHPYFVAEFTERGIDFAPRRAGPRWRWSFASLSTSAGARIDTRRGVAPEPASDGTVRYPRGPIIEQYVPRAGSVEQQFVLPTALELAGHDLVVTGAAHSPGRFEQTQRGWHWRTDAGAVTLGDVTVFDAHGRELPARMLVAAGSTRIEVDGAALARAAYPVTIDPEIGTNDFRISQMGTDGDGLIRALRPSVAYNASDVEYLVVWDSDDLVQNEREIYGQRVDALSGALLGSRIQISDMGPGGNAAYQAFDPDVAYNATDSEYLVVWHGDDDAAGTEGKFEVYGQRLVAASGAETGTNDFRISVTGTSTDVATNASCPAVAWDATNDQYLVVWDGDEVDDQFEIHGQLLSATGAELGSDDFRISDMGTNDADVQFGAFVPDVAYNASDDEYLVVWQGDDDSGMLVDGEFEIYGQRLTALSGAEVGSNDFRISQMGPADGIPDVGAASPAVAFDSTNVEYLVVWDADDLILDEFEIYGQLLDASTGAEIGSDDFRISDMGPDGNILFMAFEPDVTYRAEGDEYLVVWEGDEANGEMEIYAQCLLGGSGAEIGGNDVRLSDMGPDGDVLRDAFRPAVASGPPATGYLVAWEGDDDTGMLANNEFEIYGQQFLPASAVPAVPGLLLGVGGLALAGLARRRIRSRASG